MLRATVLAALSFLFISPLYGSSCDAIASHFDQFPYLDQLRSESHQFVWRDGHYTGCRVEQISSPHLMGFDFVPQQLWPASWLVWQQQVNSWVVIHDGNFCRIAFQQGDEWWIQAECALAPLLLLQ